jgi:hypothetical protein
MRVVEGQTSRTGEGELEVNRNANRAREATGRERKQLDMNSNDFPAFQQSWKSNRSYLGVHPWPRTSRPFCSATELSPTVRC